MKNSKAFSLIETLVTSLIGSIVLTGIAMFFTVLSTEIYNLYGFAQVQTASNTTMNQIFEDVRQGYSCEADDNELIIFGADNKEQVVYEVRKVKGKKRIFKRDFRITGSKPEQLPWINDKVDLECDFGTGIANHISMKLVLTYSDKNCKVQSKTIQRDVYSRNSVN